MPPSPSREASRTHARQFAQLLLTAPYHHLSITTLHYHPLPPNHDPPTCPITTLLQRLFEGDSCEELWPEGGRLLEEPTGGIGLQACRLEVAAAFMGGSPEAPAVFEAGTPWWRA